MELAKATAVRNEADLRDPAYQKIRDLIYQVSGIYQSDEKLYLLASRCARRMNAVKVKTPSEYLDRLRPGGSGSAELRSLLNEFTIGETYMFRSASQLDALHNVILPSIIQAKGSLGFKRLHIWSAGCSTGEEPYTLAMFLLEECETLLKDWTFDILATDLNDDSLTAAKNAIYGEYALRNTAETLRKKYFQPYDEKRLQAGVRLKSSVRFERVNLNDDGRMSLFTGMDLIFCCNVLIYFDLASKRKVMQHFHSSLIPGGYLFLGQAESLYRADERFKLVHFPGAIGYWKSPVGHKNERKSP